MDNQAESLYTVLGVARDASAKEIKDAFRRMSSRHHPDRDGGSGEMIVRVNEAYAVLSDEERRSVYDTTGKTVSPPAIEFEADQLLIQLFSQLLDADPGTFLTSVKASLNASISNAMQARSQAVARTTRLTNRMNATAVKEGATNLVHGIIQQQLEGMKNAIEQAARAIAVMELAKLKAGDYVSTETQHLQQTHVVYTSTSSATTWR